VWEAYPKRRCVRKLLPSDGWQTTAAAVARPVVEDEHEDAVEDSAGPVKWVVPAWEVVAHDRAGWRRGLESSRVRECEGRHVPRHSGEAVLLAPSWVAQERPCYKEELVARTTPKTEGGLWTGCRYSRYQSAGARWWC
jgi:hypothetical protein